MTKSNQEAQARVWLDVDLGALIRNARRFQQLIGAPILPMVKADAYGLGAVPVARALETVEPWGFGVATPEEAAALREGGIERPIIAFTPLAPERVGEFVAGGIRPVIGDFAALAAWLAHPGSGPFHVEIDTGMSRSGFRWQETADLDQLAERLAEAEKWEGVFTHFHSADSDEHSCEEQAERFQEVLDRLGRRPPIVHLSSSAGAQFGARYQGDLARPGIFLYGGRAGTLEPEPVARLCARVIALRRLRPGDTVSYGAEAMVEAETTIATLGVGYGDGVSRSLGNRGMVELGGALVPVVGRVTMDMIMVDVEDTPVRVGDTATIFGGLLPLDEQAALVGTNSYELLTALMPRVTRRYQGTP